VVGLGVGEVRLDAFVGVDDRRPELGREAEGLDEVPDADLRARQRAVGA
jgi:hypothetical protein